MPSKNASPKSSEPGDASAKRKALAERVAKEALAGDLLQAIRAYRVGLEETGNDLLFAGELGKLDLFFLLWYLLHRQDMEDPWVYERTREVQRYPDGYLDLWAREHYKSTIITLGLTIQDIVNDPEETFGIFSHTRPIAKQFLRQIKGEFEGNEDLKGAYPDVLWTNPKKESPKWSEDEGIVVKRKGNPKESTVEAWGLVDNLPTSKHFGKLIYDDVLDPKSVTGPEMIKKTTDAWAMSLNLGKRGGKRRTAGTRYHTADTYREMIERGSVIPRIYKATVDGTETGEPVLLTVEELQAKRRDMGPYIFGSQMMQDPTHDKAQGFKEDWLRYWPAERYANLNIYILVDPAGKKKKTNDYSVFSVVGLGPDRNYYVLRWVRDRLNLAERTKMLFKLHRQYKPRGVGYEEYGMQSDIDSVKDTQEATNYRFDVVALGGPLDNEDRVKQLVPLFEQGRIWIPQRCDFVDHEANRRDLTREFVFDEYLDFPVARHDDMLVSLARVLDAELKVDWPKEMSQSEMPKWMQAMLARDQQGGSFMSR